MVEIFHKQHAEVDSTTLAGGNALSVGVILQNNTDRNFMLKNLISHFHVSVPNIGDSFVLVLAQADASAAEVASAMDDTSQAYEDSVAYRDGQVIVRRVWDIQSIEYDGLVAGGSVQRKVMWKLPPKGIPNLKGRGLSVFVVNTDTAVAFSNGPSFKGFSKLMGGWF